MLLHYFTIKALSRNEGFMSTEMLQVFKTFEIVAEVLSLYLQCNGVKL